MCRVLGFLCSMTLVTSKIYFSETFDDAWESRWQLSKLKESEGKQGKWALSAGKWFKDEDEDRGLQTAEDSKVFGVSAGFDTFSNKDKELIIQFQLKYEQDVECGGAYVKVGPRIDDPAKFGDSTPYNIMFGPDQCGYSKRTQLIFNYKGNAVEKKESMPFKQNGLGVSHLYRLTLKPDHKVYVDIDELQVFFGDLRDDWEIFKTSPFMPDPTDKKPPSWVDEFMIDDVNDKKPKNWVEEKRIIDSRFTLPPDWDEEEDGEWEPPMRDNPKYKGEWKASRIPNPSYSGYWQARTIYNPDYKEDDEAYRYDNFGFIGMDLWQVRGGTIFDNIIICDDKAEADMFALRWRALSQHERAERKAERKAEKAEKKKAEKKDSEQI